MKNYKYFCICKDKFCRNLKLNSFYEAKDDAGAIAKGLLYIVDETGQPNLYPKEYFRKYSLEEIEKNKKQIFDYYGYK